MSPGGDPTNGAVPIASGDDVRWCRASDRAPPLRGARTRGRPRSPRTRGGVGARQPAADPANLVVASRRIVGRHPEAGQLWWLCSRLLVADDPSRLAWELADVLDDDPVVEVLARELPAGATW